MTGSCAAKHVEKGCKVTLSRISYHNVFLLIVAWCRWSWAGWKIDWTVAILLQGNKGNAQSFRDRFPYIFMFALLILSRSFHARLGVEPMNCDALWFKWIVAMHYDSNSSFNVFIIKVPSSLCSWRPCFSVAHFISWWYLFHLLTDFYFRGLSKTQKKSWIQTFLC